MSDQTSPRTPGLPAFVIITLLSACNASAPPPAPQVLAALQNCSSPPGVHLVEDLPALTRALYGNRIDSPNVSVPGGVRALVVVANDKTSAGHSLELTDSHYAGEVLNIHVQEHSPPEDAVTAAVMTRPCLAIGLPPAGYSEVVVNSPAGIMATVVLPPAGAAGVSKGSE